MIRQINGFERIMGLEWPVRYVGALGPRNGLPASRTGLVCVNFGG